MAERGECSASAKPSDEIWAKLVPSDSRYSDVEMRSEKDEICSEILATSSDKHSWCKIVRNSDLCSATMENRSSNTILVDGAEVGNNDTVVIKDGSEVIPGPDREGFVSYRFHIMMSIPETYQRQLKICVDVEHAKCSICLSIWHDVVTLAPCLHNFCNGCFSEWSRKSKEKCLTVLCPQCRAAVQFVGRNHFLRTIAEDMVRADSSLRRSDEEVALLDTYASVRSNLVYVENKKKGPGTSAAEGQNVYDSGNEEDSLDEDSSMDDSGNDDDSLDDSGNEDDGLDEDQPTAARTNGSGPFTDSAPAWFVAFEERIMQRFDRMKERLDAGFDSLELRLAGIARFLGTHPPPAE